MFDRLYQRMIDLCLVAGQHEPRGWGGAIQRDLMPLLGHEKLRHHHGILKEGFERARDPVNVFVVGKGNFGKSSLINALWGRVIAKVNFLPATWHITRYRAAVEQPRFEIHYNATTASAARFEESCRRLVPSAEIANGVVTLDNEEELKAVLSAEDAACQQKQHCPVWQVIHEQATADADRLGLELVDTPGFQQARWQSVEQTSVDEFYHRADVVVWMMLADKLNDSDTRENLLALSRYGKPIVAVINRADLMESESQRAEAVAFIQKEYGHLVRGIYLVSAKRGFEARETKNETAFIHSGLASLIGMIRGLAVRDTKALSLYSTSRQAVREACVILRSEADVLEQNLAKLKKNLETAESYVDLAKPEITGQKTNITEAIAAQARLKVIETKDTTPGSGPPFNAAAVEEAVHRVATAEVGRIAPSMEAKLRGIQDEISLNAYADLVYGGDANIQAHGSATSFKVNLDHLARNITIKPIQIGFWARQFRKAVNWGRRKWNELMKTFTRNHLSDYELDCRERESEFNDCVAGISSFAKEVYQDVESDVVRALGAASHDLQAEIRRCFEAAFESEAVAQRNVDLQRRLAEAAHAPSPFLYSATHYLRATWKNGAAAQLPPQGSQQKPRKKRNRNSG